ncbi:MAG: hypothetical protein ABS76_26805 [Pelagibacterium sp. SCN 64-44]|nr:MAG: hypothetical protein ABS76_26805 [Pelagibacterium sp. SCN 64-44]
METIIAGLALDGTDGPVLARAGQLAGQHGARLMLVHVLEAPPAAEAEGLDLEGATRLLKEAAAARLAELAGGLAADIRIAWGRPFEVLSGLIAVEKAGLLVIGPGRPRTLREKIFGSTADRLVREAAVPVLVVRRPAEGPYRHVVVAADLSPQSLSAAQAARALAPEAAFEHLHVVDIPLSFEQALRRAGTPEAGIARYRQARLAGARERLEIAFAGVEPLRLRLVHGSARAVLLRRARSRRVDLVALGTHGRDAAAQMLLGSVARAVLSAAACDVLIAAR